MVRVGTAAQAALVMGAISARSMLAAEFLSSAT
jgi:hypothetical protein